MDLASIFTGNDGGGVVAQEEAQVRGLRHAVGCTCVGVPLLPPAATATTRGAVVEEHARLDERPVEVVAGDDAVPGCTSCKVIFDLQL
jgi:hypothetical protein